MVVVTVQVNKRGREILYPGCRRSLVKGDNGDLDTVIDIPNPASGYVSRVPGDSLDVNIIVHIRAVDKRIHSPMSFPL